MVYRSVSAAYLPQLFCSGKLVIDSFDCDTDSYWLSSVGYVQFVYCNGDPVVWAHSSVFPQQHMWLCVMSVYMTWQTKCTIMCHSLHKCTTFTMGSIPIHSKTTACSAKEANIAVYQSLFQGNMTFHYKVTEILRDNGCQRAFQPVLSESCWLAVVMNYSCAAKVGIESKRNVLKLPCEIKLKGLCRDWCGKLSNDSVSLFVL